MSRVKIISYNVKVIVSQQTISESGEAQLKDILLTHQFLSLLSKLHGDKCFDIICVFIRVSYLFSTIAHNFI